ncbi:MAG TPA: polymer-forming cytoskeletal protein [candidate division Zixibacteria bacterium]|nr:polymer-forming cytoskeletal protein [candidate division Zixibacteria bacterium]
MSTILGKETTFTGTIELKGGLRIDGVVKGKIVSTDEVTIGQTGKVEAEIDAREVIVAGQLVGDINASEKIELQSTSDVEGDLRSKSLVIEQGAVFCGGCHMKEGSRRAQKTLTRETPSKPTADKDEKELAEAVGGGGSAFGLPFKSRKDD